jgi:magnesium transporter
MVHNRTMTEPTSGPGDAAGPPDSQPRNSEPRDTGPQLKVASAISVSSPTQCLARTRLYRHGQLELEGFPVADISDYLPDESVTIWLDLSAPTQDDLAVLSEEFGLHQLAVEDALHLGQRSKLDRYRTHLFLSAYWARFDADTGELATSELSAFITSRALITVREDDRLDIEAVVERWDENPDLVRCGVGYLVYGLLDYLVDSHFEAVQSLDDCVEDVEDRLFEDAGRGIEVQRRSFQLRKSLVLLRRLVIPMREVVNALMRRDLHVVGEELVPYYQDIYDHVLRAAEWTDGLRDMVTSILETNVTIQGNRLNVITKKVTGWAAIIAIPTLITGYFGMNVPYPGFNTRPGFDVSIITMIVAGLVLYFVFKKKDWL